MLGYIKNAVDFTYPIVVVTFITAVLEQSAPRNLMIIPGKNKYPIPKNNDISKSTAKRTFKTDGMTILILMVSLSEMPDKRTEKQQTKSMTA